MRPTTAFMAASHLRFFLSTCLSSSIFNPGSDAFIIITALPAALAGIVWMLFLTKTTLSVPALTGAIMCVGVATANSILVVSFARDRMNGGDPPRGRVGGRLHSVSAGAHDGAGYDYRHDSDGIGFWGRRRQNAPLGRAVIGGLIFATIATLIFVPTVFSIIHGRSIVHPPHRRGDLRCLTRNFGAMHSLR